MPSANIEADPEKAAAMNFVIAIPTFASSAAMIARIEPEVLMLVIYPTVTCPSGRRYLSRKQVCVKAHRGFKSLRHRHAPQVVEKRLGGFFYPQVRSQKSVLAIDGQSLFPGDSFYRFRIDGRNGGNMFWEQAFWFPWIQIEIPVWRPILIIMQFAYLYWVINSLLQILRVDSMVAGWKLYWLAVVYLVPLVGPLIWLFSFVNPNRPRRKIKT